MKIGSCLAGLQNSLHDPILEVVATHGLDLEMRLEVDEAENPSASTEAGGGIDAHTAESLNLSEGVDDGVEAFSTNVGFDFFHLWGLDRASVRFKRDSPRRR